MVPSCLGTTQVGDTVVVVDVTDDTGAMPSTTNCAATSDGCFELDCVEVERRGTLAVYLIHGTCSGIKIEAQL